MKTPSFADLAPHVERLFPPAQPAVAAVLDEERVAFARLARGEAAPRLVGWFAAPVPAGAVQASSLATGLDAAALRPLLLAAREAVAPAGGPIALALPDSVVRVAVMASTDLPSGRDERREMIAWRLKKILPYRIEDAQIDSQVFAGADGKSVVIAAAVRRKIILEYEALLASAGFQAGTVTSSTLALAELLPRRLAGDTLLLHVGAGWYSMLITDGRVPVLVRSKSLPEQERSGSLRDEAILSEIAPTLEYHSGRLSRPALRQAFVHAAADSDALVQRLHEVLPVAPEPLPPAAWSQAPPGIAGALAPAFALAARGLDFEARRAGATEAA